MGTSNHRLDCSWVKRVKSWPNVTLSGSFWQSHAALSPCMQEAAAAVLVESCLAVFPSQASEGRKVELAYSICGQCANSLSCSRWCGYSCCWRGV